MLLSGSVGNAAAKDLELIAGFGDLDACDVGRGRLLRVGQLHAVCLRPPKDALLVADREPVERYEVMHPSHCQHMTATLSGVTRRDQRDVSGAADLWVGCAVDKA